MSLEQAPPPEDPTPGYKPDPLGSDNLRRWTGTKWAAQVTRPKGKGMGPGMKWMIGIVCAIVVVAGIASLGEEDDTSGKDRQVAPAPVAVDNSTNAAADKPKPEPEPEPSLTPGQENALQSASSYLAISPFSRSGLIEQLVYEGYSKKDAAFAADLSFVNWKQQAYKAAKKYLSISSFSLASLIEQLEYEGYTSAQAEYGANRAYNGG